jgi:hypothetical protein
MSQKGDRRTMQLRRTLLSAAITTALVLGLSSCGGKDDATQQPPVSDPPASTPSTPKPSVTPAVPTAAANAKVLADYQTFVATRTRGFLSNSPTFPYEDVMTGEALQAQKAGMTGAYDIGTKYSGAARFLKAHVVSLNLQAKPATAKVQACILDSLASTSKSGKKTGGTPQEVSTDDQMVLVGGKWKTSINRTLDKTAAGCTKISGHVTKRG